MLGLSMEDSLRQNKLCGFFCVVLAVNSPQECEQGELCEALEFGTRCFIFGNGADVGFRTENGVVLSLVRGTCGDSAMEMDTKENFGVLNEDLGKSQGFEGECRSSRTKRRRIGLVHGSMSAVVQLHALKMHKCLEFVARVVRVLVRENKDARAVVLIDVYLPLALWSGWQFPRSGSTAAALFRHLSCDWKERNSTLLGEWQYCKYANQDEETIWKLSDCHVFKCKVHRSALGISRRKLFELHEIFKNLPVLGKEGKTYSTTIKPEDESLRSGIWEVSDDVLTNILMALSPVDLVRVAATCRHLRSLAVMVMPCMKLKLFPHQQAAVEWMLHREHNIGVLPHPLYMNFLTEDGFPLYINSVTGEIVTGIAPTIRDFRGGLFCDEPGLGKTITAISLILKTLGTLADPPDGIEVIWCMHNFEKKCGYYEISSSKLTPGNVTSSLKRLMDTRGQRGCLLPDMFPPGGNSKSSTKRGRSLCYESDEFVTSADSCSDKLGITSSTRLSTPKTRVFRCAKSLNRVKRNLLETYDADFSLSERTKSCNSSNKRKHIASNPRHGSLDNFSVPSRSMYTFSKPREVTANNSECNETWVQCDACRKWRKLSNTSIPDATAVWFCSMNMDPLHQKCSAPEESWDLRQPITILPGFYTKGTPGGTEQNVSFFTSVLKEHCTLINSETKKALTWLAKLSQDKLSEMETVGLARPVFDTVSAAGGDACGYHKIFQSFGLVRRIEKEKSRWYYPQPLDNLSFDLAALQIALTKPLDSFRLYLSRATLIVVPANLVDHWLTQIQKHVRPGQLRVFVWTDNKKPRAHNLAWDNDIVITTFNRLSAEWGPRKRSVLMQVHWLRVMLDEGHTLGSSLNLTNKLQMAISLTASNRWLLTGTPTPNTPNSQVSHLQPMLKFLHEEAYGQDEKSWEAGIFRPFEAEMQEGRSRLLQLLHRCMISARKIDLHTIPPCIKKVTFLNFNEEHAKSYNELVVTVQRNILMADWNDPSHVESLLNPKQWKFRSNTIRNVRLSCCVAGHIKVTDAGQDIQETMDILAEQGLDHSSEEYASIKYYLINGGNCFRCSEWCRLPVITPCRHLLCLDCIALDSEKCTFPGCGNLYEMQSPEILTRPENPNPKWPVPKDLIELQPSYKQDDWDPDWQATSSSKVSYLIERLKALQAVDRKMICLIDGNDDARHRDGLHWTSQKVPQLQEPCCKTTSESCNISAEKVIIFSQFLEHIHVIEEQLKVAGIKFAGMYSPMHSINKMKSLANFQHDATCMALLMDGSAALGLDLSFVTHVFLMEPIWDRSMEEQVISRAHRMGATRPIHVETLAMRGTIEEQMVEFLQDAYECRRKLKVECGRNDREGARVRRTLHDFAESNYLSQLSFVRTNAKT